VLVGFTVGDDAARVDRRLARALALTRRAEPGWLTEHLAQTAYPDAVTLTAALPGGWRVEREIGLGNTGLLLAVSIAEHLPVAHRLARRADWWYLRRGPLEWVNRGRTYRRLWLLSPRQGAERDQT
jgi:hypothetical protein